MGELVFASTSNGVTDDGRVPAPDAPSYVAVDRSNGSPVWSDASPGPRLIDGQWGSPAHGRVGGRDQVIFPGGDGWLYAFDPATGRALWRFDGDSATGADDTTSTARDANRHAFVATPVVHEGTVYIAVGRDPEVSLRPGVLWAVDAAGSGDITASGVRWRFVDSDFGRAIATVAVAGGVV